MNIFPVASYSATDMSIYGYSDFFKHSIYFLDGNSLFGWVTHLRKQAVIKGGWFRRGSIQLRDINAYDTKTIKKGSDIFVARFMEGKIPL